MEKELQTLALENTLDEILACQEAEIESMSQQEFNKMRERAQNAEKQLLQMIDDTPARGENGRL